MALMAFWSAAALCRFQCRDISMRSEFFERIEMRNGWSASLCANLFLRNDIPPITGPLLCVKYSSVSASSICRAGVEVLQFLRQGILSVDN
jgi:hypothetical protein